MPGDLWISGPVIRDRSRDGLCLPELVDFHHPGRDGAACRLPDQTTNETRGKKQVAEGDQPPVARLETGGTDALVPDLGGLLVGRLRLWCAAIADRGAAKHQRSSFRLTEVEPPP